MEIALIVIVDENNGIGKNNKLLCHLPADLKRFKELTTGHSIIMGRKTFESLPNGPLPNRRNIVITKNINFDANGCQVVHSVEQTLDMIKNESKVFVIGGEQIYNEFIDTADILYITKIKHVFEADAFFPKIDFNKWQLIEQIDKESDDKNKYDYSFRKYTYLK